jgi:hypothetical protein
MPVDTSMYGNLQQPNPMQTFGNMVGIANAVQQNKALQNQNVGTSIDAEETQKIQPILKDIASYSDERGNIDFNKLIPLVMGTAPKNGANIITNLAQAQQQKTAAQRAISTQSSEALQRASQAIFGMDPDKVTPDILDQTANALNKNFTDPQSQAATKQIFGNLGKVLQKAPAGDPMRKTAFSHAAMMYQPVETQQSVGNSQNPIMNDAQGNVITANRAPTGQVTGVSGAPVVASDNPNSPTPFSLPQGETKETKSVQDDLRQKVSIAAGKVPDQHMYNQNVIRMVSDPDFTNPNNFAGILKKYGSKGGVGTDYKTTLDMAAHNLAMAQQANEAAMGVSTDAGRKVSELATGSLSMTPQALASAAKMQDASASGLAAFNEGKEKAITSKGNNVFEQRRFQNDWAKVYNSEAMMLHNAVQSGDKEMISEIKRQAQSIDANYKGTGIAPGGMKDLIQRSKLMESLIKTGSLPESK